jgi:hypothetical protein
VPRQRSEPPPPSQRWTPPTGKETEDAQEQPGGPQLRAEQVAVVLLGSFNPSIFQPWWMAHQGLIDATEAESAEIGIIHPGAVAFKIGPIGLDATRERFQAQTEDASAIESLRDLVVGTFGRLSHTPIAAMGLNRATHHAMPDNEAWQAIGHRLLPKGPWEDVLTQPGTRNITVEGRQTDGRPGYIQAIFEPSVVYPEAVFQMVNDHIQLNENDPEKNIRASEAMDVLVETWEESLARAHAIADHILSYG